MVFVVKGCRAKVNQQDVWVSDHVVFPALLCAEVDVILVVDEEHVLRLEVCVCEPHRMEVCRREERGRWRAGGGEGEVVRGGGGRRWR